MKTIKDFKSRIAVGTKLATKLYWYINGEEVQMSDWPSREITIVNSVGFATATWSEEEQKFNNSYKEWPKKAEFFPIDDNTVEIRFGFGKLIYTFI